MGFFDWLFDRLPGRKRATTNTAHDRGIVTSVPASAPEALVGAMADPMPAADAEPPGIVITLPDAAAEDAVLAPEAAAAAIDDAPDIEAREAAASAEPPVSPELQPALDAYQRDEFARVFALAAPHAGHRALQLRADANRLCALALCGLDRHADAFDHWLALFECEPSAHNALQLATTSVMCDEVDRGEAWLEKFDGINARSDEMSPVLARTNFLSALVQRGKMSRALHYLDGLKEVYAQVGSTDSTLLYLRGIPPFGVFLESSLPILRATLSPANVRSWYDTLDGRLDADGRRALDAWIASLAVAA